MIPESRIYFDWQPAVLRTSYWTLCIGTCLYTASQQTGHTYYA